MKYLYWVIMGLIVAGGIGFSVYMSQEPEIVSKVQYAQYSDPAKLADALVAELAGDIGSAQLVMLGVMPGRKMDLEVWKAFLEQTQKPELQFQVVVIDPDLPMASEFFPKALKMDLKKETSRFIEGAKNARSQKMRMAVIVPSIYASQSLSENPADIINKTSDLKPLSFSLLGFPRSPEQEAQMEIPCVMGSNDKLGTGALGCMAVQKGRLLYRQKSKTDFYEGIIDLVKERDYLILFNSK
jgi:hypothetical protein